MAQGYAQVEGKPMLVLAHSTAHAVPRLRQPIAHTAQSDAALHGESPLRRRSGRYLCVSANVAPAAQGRININPPAAVATCHSNASAARQGCSARRDSNHGLVLRRLWE
jgi:hypothetical protein